MFTTVKAALCTGNCWRYIAIPEYLVHSIVPTSAQGSLTGEAVMMTVTATQQSAVAICRGPCSSRNHQAMVWPSQLDMLDTCRLDVAPAGGLEEVSTGRWPSCRCTRAPEGLLLLCAEVLEAEQNHQAVFQPLPFHYIEISKLLLSQAKDTFGEADENVTYHVCTALEDCRQNCI